MGRCLGSEAQSAHCKWPETLEHSAHELHVAAVAHVPVEGTVVGKLVRFGLEDIYVALGVAALQVAVNANHSLVLLRHHHVSPYRFLVLPCKRVVEGRSASLGSSFVIDLAVGFCVDISVADKPQFGVVWLCGYLQLLGLEGH